MAFLNRLNRTIRTIENLAGTVMEANRTLNRDSGRVEQSVDPVQEQLRIIGEYYYGVYESGGEVAQEVVEACETIRRHTEAAKRAQMGSAAGQSPEIVCAKCGAHNREGAAFCCACGGKLAVQQEARICPACGNAVAQERRFCGECGHKMDESCE